MLFLIKAGDKVRLNQSRHKVGLECDKLSPQPQLEIEPLLCLT